MAYDDALFQLGMDLTRSSTAQKEDHGENARVACGNHTSLCSERESVRHAGHHLIIDLYDARRLDDVAHIERTLKRCVEVAGATMVHIHLHRDTTSGSVSGIAILPESHISIHSRPAAGYAALDIYMPDGARPHACVEVLKKAFETRDVVVKTQQRGMARDAMAWKADAAATVRSFKAPSRQRARVSRAA